MQPNDPDIDPLEALQALRKIGGEFGCLAERQFDGIDIELKRLRTAVENLGARPARPPVGSGEYVRQWMEYCQGKRKDIEPRAEKYLCWEPEIATDGRFQKYLDLSTRQLSARSLQGLVRACHVKWCRQLSHGPIAARIRQRIHRYDGSNRIIELWRAHLEMILGSTGDKMLAQRLVDQRQSVSTACDVWKLDENTAYVREAVKQALAASLLSKNRNSQSEEFVLQHLLGWSKWADADFREQAARIILAAEGGNSFSERLKQIIIDDSRLGDPRLPRTSANWLGFDEARARFTEWLSREDIVFFFEHVLPRGADPHGRKKFWLHYVRAIHRSRPLLSLDDRARLIGIKKSEIGHFGRIEGLTSAFMLDFGKIVAVEFSKSGNACYIYARQNFDQIVPNFWDTRPFAVRDLKSRSEAGGWVIHDRDGRWYEELSSFLARQGIRPSKETK